jgi:hypothetical protein
MDETSYPACGVSKKIELATTKNQLAGNIHPGGEEI